MAEGLQDKQGSNKQFLKLKEDKRDGSKTKGQYRFFQQEKVNGVWTSTNEGNSMSGVLKSLETKGSKLFKTTGNSWFSSYSLNKFMISSFEHLFCVNKVTFITPTVSVGTLKELDEISSEFIYSKT